MYVENLKINVHIKAMDREQSWHLLLSYTKNRRELSYMNRELYPILLIVLKYDIIF